MRYYPVFLDLRGKYCLVVGAGSVGRRKILGLLRAEPESLLILDTSPPGKELRAIIEEAQQRTRLCFEQRSFEVSDLYRFDHCALVFAATGNRETNAGIAAICAASGVLCNCVDDPKLGSFLVPAVVEREKMTIALSTGGGSPALVKKMREEIAIWIGERFDGLAELMARLRPLVLAMNRETGQNTELFRRMIDSELADALQRGDRDVCERCLRDVLPQEIHLHIEELLHDLA